MNHDKHKHIIVGLSGGVDSAVAAYLLKKSGHHVEAMFMKNWESDDTDTHCTAALDLADAQAVCDKLSIKLHLVNFATEYWQDVFSHFLAEIQAGRTPNPDVLCNKEIKFKAFLNYAKQLGASCIATGHYARTQQGKLFKALDLNKDQSYFLYALNQTQLQNSLFPLGELTKPTVRAIAKSIKLPNHAKKDSTGICFIGERKFKPFLKNYLTAQPGEIKTVDGEIVGQHDGLLFYTIGQRQGLCIGGKQNKAQLPWYVIAKDSKHNILVVAQGDDPALYCTQLIARDVHWINSTHTFPLHAFAKTRYRQTDQACIIEQIESSDYQVSFTQAQRAITPGQAIVFYQGDICLGGGSIAR